jgi:hypothetical protein
MTTKRITDGILAIALLVLFAVMIFDEWRTGLSNYEQVCFWLLQVSLFFYFVKEFLNKQKQIN